MAAATAETIFDVVVVGAGIAGSSVAFHLLQDSSSTCSSSTTVLVIDAGATAGEGVGPTRKSGSATMDQDVAPCIKMMTQVFAGNCDEFVRHHGRDGPRRYLRATQEGLVQQKKIAKEIWNDQVGQNIKELGSYYLAYEQDEQTLKKEFENLRHFGCEDIEWCNKERLQSVDGMSSKFHCGIYFPKDAIIDSSLYAKTLLQYTLDHSDGKTQFWPNSVVTQIQDDDKDNTAPYAIITLESGSQIYAKQVVMATGGLYQDPKLNGILQPCFSYLVHVPISGSDSECSPNFFTWNFTHDWCYTNGKVRCSGEDHFSAYKPPMAEERCKNLSKWTMEQYDCYDPITADDESSSLWSQIPQQYGLYSETPDMAPLIGHLTQTSRVCYIVGCNAWGQAILSYCSSLVPGLLNMKELSDEQNDCMKLLTIRRFSNLPAC